MKTILSLTVMMILLISCKEEIKQSTKPVAVTDEIFQYSIWNAFAEKEYEGNLKIKKIGTYSDFGLGTFNSLDGEMILLDGIYYRAAANGDISKVDPNEESPFVTVKFFSIDDSLKIDSEVKQDSLYKLLRGKINKDQLTAIKIEGQFSYLKTRSIEKQTKPYPEVKVVIENQIIKEYNNVEGTLVGFWYPQKFKEINFAGFHFHFISKDKKKGGHLLDFVIAEGDAEFDFTDELFIKL